MIFWLARKGSNWSCIRRHQGANTFGVSISA